MTPSNKPSLSKSEWKNWIVFVILAFIWGGSFILIKKGLIHFNKSDRRAKPCPTYALQARTSEGQYVRVIFAQCDNQTKVVTCYDLEREYPCDCPGD